MHTRELYFLFILILLTSFSCKKDPEFPDVNFRDEMRDLVIGISEYAKNIHPGFYIVPQNGIELVTTDGEENGTLHMEYLAAVDGHGQEDLFYGYDDDDQATPQNELEYLKAFLDQSKNAANSILVTDYTSTQSKMDDSYAQNNDAGYISFAAPERDLNIIPDYPNPIFGENNNHIAAMSSVRNFLYLINTENYASKSDFINAVTATNYDLLIMDLFFEGNTSFNLEEINQLKNKSNGGKRIVLSYMSIGEAEDYRYYWQQGWFNSKPEWMDGENPFWEGNYKVQYWQPQWQDIIYGNDNSYLKKILDAGFDGVYLDIIDAFEFYE